LHRHWDGKLLISLGRKEEDQLFHEI
jgi:hypothetical protein